MSVRGGGGSALLGALVGAAAVTLAHPPVAGAAGEKGATGPTGPAGPTQYGYAQANITGGPTTFGVGWTPTVFTAVPQSTGVNITTGAANVCTFSLAGRWRITATMRSDQDAWQGARLVSSAGTAGASASMNSVAGAPMVFDFIANVADVTIPYVFQMGADAVTDVLAPGPIGGVTLPAIVVLFTWVGP